VDWDRAREMAADGRPTPEELASLLEAIAYFERYAPKNWLGWQSDWPLAQSFFGRYLECPHEGVRLYRQLTGLETVPDLKFSRSELFAKEHGKFQAAMMTLNLASAARNAGHAIEFLGVDGKRIADLRISLHERPVTVECFRLQESKVMFDAEQVERRLSRWLAESGTNFRGQTMVTIHDGVRSDETLRRLEELYGGVQQLVRDGQAHVVIPGFADIEFSVGLSFLPVPIRGHGSEPIGRDIDRLAGRLWEKSAQLGRGGASIFMARPRHLLVFDTLRFELVLAAATRFEEALASLPHVSAVVMHQTWLGSPPPQFVHDGGSIWVDQGRTSEGFARISVVVVNMGATNPLSPLELAALRALLRVM
jgi:hypothetical protein